MRADKVSVRVAGQTTGGSQMPGAQEEKRVRARAIQLGYGQWKHF